MSAAEYRLEGTETIRWITSEKLIRLACDPRLDPRLREEYQREITRRTSGPRTKENAECQTPPPIPRPS